MCKSLLGSVLLASWLVLIWYFGESQALAMTGSGPGLRWLARKALHVPVYAVLGALLAVMVGRDRRWGLFSLCLLIALADELHQHFVPHRAFSLWDVGLDLIGGTLGVTLRLSWRGAA